jgi:hypothetical protein
MGIEPTGTLSVLPNAVALPACVIDSTTASSAGSAPATIGR